MSFEDYLKYRQESSKNKISDHFTVFNIINSVTAVAKKIDNRPTAQIITNGTALAKNILEKIPFAFGINCWFRGDLLNKLVGGVESSQHKTGQAVDITPTKNTIDEVFNWIKHNLIYDQLIHEGTWIHVSFSLVKNRRQALKLIKGKYVPC